MYSGVSVDALIQGSLESHGASLAYVKKRDYDGGLSHRSYSAVTGFHHILWPIFIITILSSCRTVFNKDKGVTFMRRTFRNGWQLGVWATLTDVSSDDFGEGPKGFYFQVPLRSVSGGGLVVQTCKQTSTGAARRWSSARGAVRKYILGPSWRARG